MYQSFMTIVGKSKKFAKPEVKVNFYLSMSQLEARTYVVTTAFACHGYFTAVASCNRGPGWRRWRVGAASIWVGVISQD